MSAILSTNLHYCQLYLYHTHVNQDKTYLRSTTITVSIKINYHQTLYLRYKRYVNSCVRLNELDENLRPYVSKQVCHVTDISTHFTTTAATHFLL